MKRRDDHQLFERAMRDVDPIAGGVERMAVRRRAKPGPEPAAPLEVTRAEGRHEGLASGGDRRQLARLEAGEYPPELTLDLHGLGAEEARAEVFRGLREARLGGLRVVRIVHGRGLRSAAGPVLKRALPGWLAMPPHGRHVLAFTDGGRHGARGGATLVLLRRRKPQRRGRRDPAD